MKQGYYIHFNAKKTAGVAKKIDMQIAEFKNYYRMEEINVLPLYHDIVHHLRNRLPLFSIQRDYQAILNQVVNADFLYIRKPLFDRAFVHFLSCVKKNNQECKIIIEIFTYPYDRDDFGKIWMWPNYPKDVYNRKRAQKYVSRYVTYSKDETIFGVKTIKTINGIDVESVCPSKRNSSNCKEINLLCIGYMQKHHGYERILNGLAEYNKKQQRKIVCHIVGVGPSIKEYKKIVNEKSLDDVVKFYGELKGKELDQMYDNIDIAVSSLGLYKIGLYLLSALKTREYLAKGLPMITGSKVDVFENISFPYYIEFPNDNSNIDMEKVVGFYDEVYNQGKSRESIVEEIREFAKKTVAMKATMEGIIEYIDNCNI